MGNNNLDITRIITKEENRQISDISPSSNHSKKSKKLLSTNENIRSGFHISDNSLASPSAQIGNNSVQSYNLFF